MRVGVIGSGGGGAFAESYQILRAAGVPQESFTVITDRNCGLGRYCDQNQIEHLRVDDCDNASFSAAAARRLGPPGGVTFVLLYFSRLVTRELYAVHPVLNIHPALLPAFPGMGAVRRAWNGKVRFLGATLHGVDGSMDGGPVVAQVVMPIPAGDPIPRLEKYSFVQKIYLTVLGYEMVSAGRLRMEASEQGCVPRVEIQPYNDRCNPAIQDQELLAGVRAVQVREGVQVIE